MNYSRFCLPQLHVIGITATQRQLLCVIKLSHHPEYNSFLGDETAGSSLWAVIKLNIFMQDIGKTEQQPLFVTDKEIPLIMALAQIFLWSKMLSYIWHLSKDIFAKKTSQVSLTHGIKYSIQNRRRSTRCDSVNCEAWSGKMRFTTWKQLDHCAEKGS